MSIILHGEESLLARFAELGIAAETHRHPPLHTVEESKQLRGDLPGAHCKSLFLKDKKGAIWLIVACEDSAVDLKTLYKLIGSARLSFGKPELLWQVLGVRPGAVTPFGLINDAEKRVNVVLETGLAEHDIVNFHPLHNEATTAISGADLRRFIEALGFSAGSVDLDRPRDVDPD